jgi:aminoglycoside phosphotransferase (APT) family kinase protein
VRAVLDWEMSTLGDPLSDAALMCVYRHPMFDMVHADAAWSSPQIPSADELAQKYSLAADLPLAHWEFYMALAYFKLAIIAAGIQFRDRMGSGAAGGDHEQGTEYGDKVGEAVAPLISMGLTELS